MPHFRLETNVPKAKIPKDLSRKICEVTAATLEKPLELCVATIIGDVDVSYFGTKDPCAQATLVSIGSLDTEKNKKHSKAYFNLICESLGISPKRMYIQFINTTTSDIGYDGTTFHDIWK